MAELRGGKFGHGFVSAGVVGAFSPSIGKIDGLKVGDISFGRVAGATLLGGTVSEISGGKFANGAATTTFQNLFNDQGLTALEKRKRSIISSITEKRYEKAFDENGRVITKIDQYGSD